MNVKLFCAVSAGVGILGLLIFRNLIGAIGIAGAIIMAAILISLTHRLAERR